MSQARSHPLEEILRLIAREAPQPWYPRQFLRGQPDDADQVSHLLEYLSLEGYIKKVPGRSLESGAGFELTQLGQQAVSDPTIMDRVLRGEALDPNDPGAVIRQSLRTRARPFITQAIVAFNVIVFLYGLVLAANVPRLANTYLMGMSGTPAYLNLLHKLGSVRLLDIQQGDYWRLMSSTVVHGGVLHILFNMYTLWGSGAFIEQTWGRWRMLTIYLISGWAGSCLAIACRDPRFAEVPLVGASGAICGILGAEAAWVFLYGRHLPASMAARGRSQVFTTLLLMVFISLMPGVSGWAHLGGAVGGLLTALFLHMQRFGYPGIRWAALLLVAAVPVASFLQMQRAQGGRPAIARKDRDDKEEKPEVKKDRKKEAKKPEKEEPPAGVAGPFLRHYAEPVRESADELLDTCLNISLQPETANADPKRTERRLAVLAKNLDRLKTTQKELEKEKYADERLEAGRQKALALVKAGIELCEVTTAYLKAPDGPGSKVFQRKYEDFNEAENEFLDLVKELRKL